MQNSIDISQYVNIATTITPAGLVRFNPNIIAYFTTIPFLNGGTRIYEKYTDATSVAKDFGSGSLPAQLANIFFAQAPNVKAGGGALKIIPLDNSINATQGVFTTADISANFANIQAIANGSINAVIDGGGVIPLKNLNFTKCQNWTDIITVLQRQLQGLANITPLSIGGVLSGFIATGKRVGTVGSVTFTSNSIGTDLSVVTLFNTGAGTATTGTASSGENLVDAKNRVASTVDYTGFFTDFIIEDDAVVSVAQDTQSKPQIFIHQVTSLLDANNGLLGSRIADLGYKQTRILGHLQDLQTAMQFKVAYTSRAFSVAFEGSNVALTMNLKSLTGVAPDTNITNGILAQFIAAGIDTYPNTAGEGKINAQGNANDYFDNQYNKIWFDITLQQNLYNTLVTTGTKIIQTEQGMTTLRNAIVAVCNQAVTSGVAGMGLTWTGDTFGNQAQFFKNITTVGYYIYSQPIAQQAPASRAAREAPLFQVALKLGGAVHFVSVQATLQQ
jgi:hypothetical protein